MRTFQYINRDIVNPIDLNTLSKTYSTLEQGHQQAVKAASDLQIEMAKLPLNEAEDAWRQQRISEIQKTIADNTTFGNAYGALDDIIAKAGDLSSDAGMIGRLRAQQDYKTYLDNLNKRTDLPEADKEYFREKNQYYYADKYDDKGNVIGGSKWTPIEQEVSHVPMDKIFTQALTWAAKETGGGQQVTFLDKNGNPTTDPNKSATGDIYTKTSTGWSKLSKEKLNAAITAAINSIPGARESIDQDYKIDKWRYEKNGENPDITDKNGILLTPEQYIDKKINPFVEAATYYNQKSEIEYGDALKAQIALSQAKTYSNGADTTGFGVADISTTTSNPITIRNIMPAEAMGAITASKQTISDLLQLEDDVSNFTSNQLESIIENRVNKGLLNPADRLKVYNALDSLLENREYLDTISSNLDDDDKAQFNTYNAITSMSDLPDNDYSKEWSSLVNSLYQGSSAIRQYFDNEDGINTFYLELGGKNKAIALGIKEGTKNGRNYVELPIEYNKSILSFAKAGSKFDKNFSFTSDVFRVNSDGTEQVVPQILDGGIAIRPMSAKPVYSNIIKYYDSLQKTNDDVVGNAGNLTVSNAVINAETPAISEILAIRKSNPENASKYTQVLNDEEKEIFKSTSQIDLVQTGAYMLNKNNTLQEINSNDRKKLTALLRSSKQGDLDIAAIQDPNTGNWGAQVTIKGTTDEDGKVKREPITFYIPGGIDSQIYESWNNDTSFKAKNDINKYKAANRDITIATPKIFGIDSHIKLQGNGYGFDIVENGNIIGSINDEQAISLRENYYNWKSATNAISSGIEVNKDALQSLMLNVAANIASIYENNPSNELILYYYNCLANSIN